MQNPERKHCQRQLWGTSPAPASFRLRGAGRVPPPSSLDLLDTQSCSLQMEDEIEAIISISDGLNLVSRHRGQPQQPAARSPGLSCFPIPPSGGWDSL